MNKSITRYLGMLLLWAVMAVGLFSAKAQAAPVTVKARLDSAQMMMGRVTTLRMEVVQDKNVKGAFEAFRHPSPDGLVTVCGDSVELNMGFKLDTLDLGSGRIQINYAIPVQSFDSGLYRLPEFVYVTGRDSVRSNAVTLKVIPVNVAADAQISGYADVMGPSESSVFDILPDFIVDFWWIILIILLVIALTVYGILRYRKKGTLLPKKPEPSPYAVAIGSLQRLKSRKLWEQGMEREYFTELTEILRVYLDRRFGINAMEMTTNQIIDKLGSDKRIKDKRDYVRQVLNMADFVKFAAVRPLPDDNVKAFDNAVRFVEETKPEEKPEEAQKVKKPDNGFELDDDEPADAPPPKKDSGKKEQPADGKLKKGGE